MRTLAAVLALLVALPVSAQANADAAPLTESAVVVDPALVGAWTLIKVQEPGAIARFGGEIEAMSCDFAADGSAEVRLAVLQDREVHEHDRTFAYATEGGEIVGEGAPPVKYEIHGGDLLVLHDATGLVVQLVRVTQ